MHIYDSHLGDLYVSDDDIDDDDLYCEECGDFDDYIGYAETKKGARRLIKENCFYTDDYIEEFVDEHWEN